MVVGTTGWYQHLERVRELVERTSSGADLWIQFFRRHEFSFQSDQDHCSGAEQGYRASIVERHHVHKKDKPSGSAVTLQKIWNPAQTRKLKLRQSAKARRRHASGHGPIRSMTPSCSRTTLNRVSDSPKARSKQLNGLWERPGFRIPGDCGPTVRIARIAKSGNRVIEKSEARSQFCNFANPPICFNMRLQGCGTALVTPFKKTRAFDEPVCASWCNGRLNREFTSCSHAAPR